jgi:hypothetical protein
VVIAAATRAATPVTALGYLISDAKSPHEASRVGVRNGNVLRLL